MTNSCIRFLGKIIIKDLQKDFYQEDKKVSLK